MKRSEMVEKIKKVWADSTSWPSDQVVAEAIMKVVEKEMVPDKAWEPEDDEVKCGAV